MQYLSYLIILVVIPTVTMSSIPTATSHHYYTLQYCMKDQLCLYVFYIKVFYMSNLHNLLNYLYNT